MGFYDLSKEERAERVAAIDAAIKHDLEQGITENMEKYASDADTYIRKNAYLAIGRLYRDRKDLQDGLLSVLGMLFTHDNELVRRRSCMRSVKSARRTQTKL